MFNFPFFRFPYPNYYPYYNNYVKKTNNSCIKSFEQNKDETIKQENYENKENQENINQNENRSYKYNSFGPIKFINPFTNDVQDNEPIIELLGLQLYLDDLIILGLLFFLYKEEVQDEMLFLALLLLLLT